MVIIGLENLTVILMDVLAMFSIIILQVIIIMLVGMQV